MTRLMKLAAQIHRDDPTAHWSGKYKGPCWGPTLKDIAEARRRLAKARAKKRGIKR